MMKISLHQQMCQLWVTRKGLLLLSCVALLASSSGCHNMPAARHAIPASRLDSCLLSCSKELLAPLPYSALGQPPIADHLIGPGDTLSVYVYGVLPINEEETPVQPRSQAVNQRYYPPHGTEIATRTGVPVSVRSDGSIDMPLIGAIAVAGLTTTQATDKLLTQYTEKKVLQKGRERVYVSLITPRVKRVIVLREDTPFEAVSLVSPGTNDQIHRGSGQVIDLPIYENDVLHALASSGGLPGTDAKRELWVIRNLPDSQRQYIDFNQLCSMADDAASPCDVADVKRIPLVGCPGTPVPFGVQDITLDDGDVVFVPRRNEYFVTGGLLPGARIPLPRDEDIDVLEAIALANGSVGGPLGQGGTALIGGSPGHMREPTQVLIVRKLPGGRQFTIRVDLSKAIKDGKERVLIQSEDVVMLYFRPSEAGINGALNWSRLNLSPFSIGGGGSGGEAGNIFP